MNLAPLREQFPFKSIKFPCGRRSGVKNERPAFMSWAPSGATTTAFITLGRGEIKGSHYGGKSGSTTKPSMSTPWHPTPVERDALERTTVDGVLFPETPSLAAPLPYETHHIGVRLQGWQNSPLQAPKKSGHCALTCKPLPPNGLALRSVLSLPGLGFKHFPCPHSPKLLGLP